MTMQSQCRPVVDPIKGHRWRMHIHLDSCHSFRSSYTCQDDGCRAVLATYNERYPKDDLSSAIWMEPTYDEEGNEQKCERCEELQNGAEPVNSMILAYA